MTGEKARSKQKKHKSCIQFSPSFIEKSYLSQITTSTTTSVVFRALEELSGSVPVNVPASASAVEDWSEGEDSTLRDAVIRHGEDWGVVRDFLMREVKNARQRALEEYEQRWIDVVCRKHKKVSKSSSSCERVIDRTGVSGAVDRR